MLRRALAVAFAASLWIGPLPAAAQWQANGVPVCTASGEQTLPVVVRSGGGVFVVWQDLRGSTSRIYAQRLNGAGEPLWAANGIEVATTVGNQKAPVAVGDGVGGVIIAWVQEVNGQDDVYAQRLSNTGARWWAAAGVPVCTASGAQNGLAIVSDLRLPLVDTPGAIIAWTDSRALTNTDIYAQAIESTGAPRWTVNGVPVCVIQNDQSDVVIVTDGTAGTQASPRGVILAWLDERVDGQSADVFSQRLNAAGAPQWLGNGVFVSTYPSPQRDLAMQFTGSASAVIAWADGRGAFRSFDIYGQKVANNAVSWATDGSPICDFAGNQTLTAIASDGAGGVVTAWRDARDFFNPGIYLQRVAPDGAPRWTVDGIAATSVARAGKPVLVASDAGSVIAIWPDSRMGGTDVFAQKIDSTGARLWGAEGVPMCLASGDQTAVAAVADSTNGAIAAWVDYRDVSGDIYANRILGVGGLVSVEENPAAKLRLSPPRPNPASGPVTLRFDLPVAEVLSARVLDVRGRLVATLVDRRRFEAGAHTLNWDGLEAGGSPAPAGLYFLRVTAGADAGTRRVVLFR